MITYTRFRHWRIEGDGEIKFAVLDLCLRGLNYLLGQTYQINLSTCTPQQWIYQVLNKDWACIEVLRELRQIFELFYAERGDRQ